MDRQTLRLVDEWLTELEREALLVVGAKYDPDTTTPQQTAYQAGKARGIADARAWIEMQARKHRPSE